LHVVEHWLTETFAELSRKLFSSQI
jgi:hypothetical protein